MKEVDVSSNNDLVVSLGSSVDGIILSLLF